MTGVRERHLESVIQKTLRQIILVSAHPRTLLQVTLQVVSAQEDESKISGLPQAASVSFAPSLLSRKERPLIPDNDQNIDILPALLQTAMLALLSTAIPLSMTMTCTLIAINPHGALSPNPTAKQLSSAGSVHVLAFSSLGDLLVVESEGQFSFDAWEQVYAEARKICLGPQEEDNDGGDDVDMDDRDERRGESLQDVLRSAVKEKVRREGRWRDSLG